MRVLVTITGPFVITDRCREPGDDDDEREIHGDAEDTGEILKDNVTMRILGGSLMTMRIIVTTLDMAPFQSLGRPAGA